MKQTALLSDCVRVHFVCGIHPCRWYHVVLSIKELVEGFSVSWYLCGVCVQWCFSKIEALCKVFIVWYLCCMGCVCVRAVRVAVIGSIIYWQQVRHSNTQYVPPCMNSCSSYVCMFIHEWLIAQWQTDCSSLSHTSLATVWCATCQVDITGQYCRPHSQHRSWTRPHLWKVTATEQCNCHTHSTLFQHLCVTIWTMYKRLDNSCMRTL